QWSVVSGQWSVGRRRRDSAYPPTGCAQPHGYRGRDASCVFGSVFEKRDLDRRLGLFAVQPDIAFEARRHTGEANASREKMVHPPIAY
ncbi:MAG: hypothetical protein WEB58_15645, partial [Planctomycetaceae bacterium]